MKGRWTLVALVASLALNLFLIGAGAGVIALGAKIARESPAAAPRQALRRAAMALPAPERRAFIAVLRQSGQTARPATRQARTLRHDAWASMAQPTFDAAAMKAQLRKARTLDQQARTTVEDAVIDFAAALPPADRARFAAAASNAMTSPPRR